MWLLVAARLLGERYARAFVSLFTTGVYRHILVFFFKQKTAYEI